MSSQPAYFAMRWSLSLALLLFLPAGTIHWIAGWVFLVIAVGGAEIITLRLARRDPALLAERRGRIWQKDQPLSDKIFMLILIIVGILWIAMMGIDAVRFHWSSWPWMIQMIGGAGLAGAIAVIDRVMIDNSFAVPVVKLQQERNQTVVRKGLYRFVRHPMYAGMVIAFFSVPLLLGSRFGLLGSFVMTALFVVRIQLEERFLVQGLPGYAAYVQQVRYRLIPFVW